MLPSCYTDSTDVKHVNMCVEFSHTTIPLVHRCVKILCHCPLMSWNPELIHLRDCNLMTTCLYYYEMISLTFESVCFCIVQWNIIRFFTSVQWVYNSCKLSECRFLTVVESVNFFIDSSKKRMIPLRLLISRWFPKFQLISFRHLRVPGNHILRRCRRWNRTVTLRLKLIFEGRLNVRLYVYQISPQHRETFPPRAPKKCPKRK